jgi:hypothetical protein
VCVPNSVPYVLCPIGCLVCVCPIGCLPYCTQGRHSARCMHMPIAYGRLGQNIFGVYTVFLAGNYQIYGHKRCTYTLLADPTNATSRDNRTGHGAVQ